jgi:hypothetical protein
MEEFKQEFPSGDHPLVNTNPSTLQGFLARSPVAFANSGNVIPYRNRDVSMPYSMTNEGLRMELSVIQYDGYKEYTVMFACHFEVNFLGPLGVYIQPVVSPDGDQFAKHVSHLNPVIVFPQHMALAQIRTTYIRQEMLLPTTRGFDRRYHFLIRTMPDERYELLEVYPSKFWHKSQKIIWSLGGSARVGAFLFRSSIKGDVEPENDVRPCVRSNHRQIEVSPGRNRG